MGSYELIMKKIPEINQYITYVRLGSVNIYAALHHSPDAAYNQAHQVFTQLTNK